jgi:hypothetical protein
LPANGPLPPRRSWSTVQDASLASTRTGQTAAFAGLSMLLPSSSEPAATVLLKTTNSSKAAATAHLEADRATAHRLVAL